MLKTLLQPKEQYRYSCSTLELTVKTEWAAANRTAKTRHFGCKIFTHFVYFYMAVRLVQSLTRRVH